MMWSFHTLFPFQLLYGPWHYLLRGPSKSQGQNSQFVASGWTLRFAVWNSLPSGLRTQWSRPRALFQSSSWDVHHLFFLWQSLLLLSNIIHEISVSGLVSNMSPTGVFSSFSSFLIQPYRNKFIFSFSLADDASVIPHTNYSVFVRRCIIPELCIHTYRLFFQLSLETTFFSLRAHKLADEWEVHGYLYLYKYVKYTFKHSYRR